VLYAVFLVTTGGEALYADLGHFGQRPIRLAWFGFVLPAVLINYFGQGARLLVQHADHVQPFFHLAPDWALLPVVILATLATCIASQAAISGAFSLTRQAVQLGQVPPLQVKQTSAEARGQVYMPAVNWMLMIATIGLTIGFGSSTNIADAYGISVNSTMVVTTILAFNVARERGGWSIWAAGAFLLAFLSVDLVFFASNLMKIPVGGWFPLLTGMVIFTVMTTWRRGGELLRAEIETEAQSMKEFIGELKKNPPARVPGTGIFLTDQLYDVPFALQHHLRLNNALHEQVVLLTVITEQVPRVPANKRVEIQDFELGFHRLLVRYGFMQGINIPSDLATCKDYEFGTEKDQVTYYVGRATPMTRHKKGGMMTWRDRLYTFMKRNTQRKTTYYRIPADRTVEIGLQVSI
jgi:KUP system potassium uptake protein